MAIDLSAKRLCTWSERPDDLRMSQPPRAVYFDSVRGEWVLSRYADVLAALHDSRLRPVGEKSGDRAAGEAGEEDVRSMTMRILSPSRISEWRASIEPLAESRMAALPADRPIDLLGEFAEPWCTSVALIVTGASAENRDRLLELARHVSAGAADPDDPDLKAAAAAAHSELKRNIPAGTQPMAAAAFVALAQTLPALLANSWLALLRHPGELSKLRAKPDLMPSAMEELLRYASLARNIKRIAHDQVCVGSEAIETGQRVTLALHSANRDPEQFAEPNRLNVTRPAVKSLVLGAGPHSCAGAALIRMAAAVATKAFVLKFHEATVFEPVEWRGGASFRAPAVLLARCRHLPRSAI